MNKLIRFLCPALLVGSAIAGPSLLVNGGFEQPSIRTLPGPWQSGWNTNWICFGPDYSLDYPNVTFPGWQIVGEVDVMTDGSVLLGSQAPVRSAEGVQFLDLDGRMPGTITQVVSVSPGRKYRFRFSYACYSPAFMSAKVLSSNGNALFTTNVSAVPDGTNTPAWSPVEAEFTAIDNSLTVTFTSTSRDLWMSGLLLDNVELLLNPDTDGDGVNDYREHQDGTDLNDPNSFNPLSRGLVAYYPLDGNANDESGFGNNGVVKGASTSAGRHGVVGTAYFFDGVDDEVAIQPAEPLIGLQGSITVVAWIYNEGLGAPTYGSQDLQGIFGPATYLAYNLDGGFGLRLFDTSHDSVNNRRYSFTVGAPRQDLYSASIAPEGSWDFVVATYDGNTMSIYRNGFLDASEVVGPGLTAGMNYGGNYFTIGQFVDWSAGTQRCPFHGKIDDVRVYNRALSASDVANLYHTEAGNLDSDGDGLADAWERGFGRYSLIQGNFSWDQAKADAESRGGHLATITSDVERLSIMSQFSESLRSNVLPWLGASDAEAEGDWKWVTGEPWGFAYWSSGNPDNGGSAYPDQDYLWAGIGANSADRQQWLWDDYANSGNSIYQNGYLLEFGYPTDPLDPDTDDDSLPDGAETGTGKFVSSSNTGTRPLDPDTSGDGILDGESVAYGFDPNVDYAPVLHFLRDKSSDGGGRFGLFTEAGMMDLNLGGVVLRKSGSTVNLRLQIQSKSDLRAPSWTTEGTETFILDMPGNKAFMRIRALGPQ